MASAQAELEGTAWSSWQYMHMYRYEDAEAKVLAERKRWYPVLRWMAEEIQKRLRKGREVMVENPWGSQMWQPAGGVTPPEIFESHT